MSSHDWADVWKLFLDVVSRENIAMQIAIGLGAAFIAVMALEGIRASFFPRRILEGMTLRDAAPPSPSLSVVPPEENMHTAAWNPAPELMSVIHASPMPRAVVNADHSRRSSPQRLRIIGARKPS